MRGFNPYALKKPCANCPFLKDQSKAIELQPGRVEGIIEGLLDGSASSFACHKTLYEPPRERWKKVVGYEGLYEVSSFGQVRKIDGTIIAQSIVKGGYKSLSLRKDGKNRKFFAHILVLTAFDKPKPAGLQCRHRNGNSADNRLENLKWGTPLENGLDKRLHGKGRGANQHLNKLTIDQVREIKASLEADEKVALLAGKYGVSRGQIYNIKNGLSWAYLDEEPEKELGHVETDDGEERYESSGKEQQCAGSLAVLEKMGRRTQLMQVMGRLDLYKPEQYIPLFDLVIDYDPS